LDILVLCVIVANVTVYIFHLYVPQPHKEIRIRNVSDDLCVYSIRFSLITESQQVTFLLMLEFSLITETQQTTFVLILEFSLITETQQMTSVFYSLRLSMITETQQMNFGFTLFDYL
jgi:hypothetical protein